MTPEQNQRHTFILRLWSQTNTWRGQIQHIPSRQTVYVKSLVEIWTFMQTHTEGFSDYPEDETSSLSPDI